MWGYEVCPLIPHRFPINETLIDMVIARLRTDDIYSQLDIYPNPGEYYYLLFLCHPKYTAIVFHSSSLFSFQSFNVFWETIF